MLFAINYHYIRETLPSNGGIHGMTPAFYQFAVSQGMVRLPG